MSEELKAKVKAIFPEDVEGIYISKNDYDRLYGDLTLENIELKEEIEKLHSIIKEVREYIDKFIKANYEDVFNQEQKEYMVKILQMLDKENKLC